MVFHWGLLLGLIQWRTLNFGTHCGVPESFYLDHGNRLVMPLSLRYCFTICKTVIVMPQPAVLFHHL